MISSAGVIDPKVQIDRLTDGRANERTGKVTTELVVDCLLYTNVSHGDLQLRGSSRSLRRATLAERAFLLESLRLVAVTLRVNSATFTSVTLRCMY